MTRLSSGEVAYRRPLMQKQNSSKTALVYSAAVLTGTRGSRLPSQKSGFSCSPKKQSQMVALRNVCARYNSLCLAFSGADTEFDFVLMTSPYTVNRT